MGASQDDLSEVRVGRNFIRVGDTVRVTPSAPKKRDGYRGKVTRIRMVEGTVTFDVIGAPRGRVPGTHTMFAERVVRVAQTRGGESTTRVPR